jgi:hypothetical protein
MPAPRCPPIHKPPAVWEDWARTYYEYKKSKPCFIPFDKFKKVRHLGDVATDRNWKYLLYLTLTGRKHRTLTYYN